MTEEEVKQGSRFFTVNYKLYPKILPLSDGKRNYNPPTSNLCPHCRENFRLRYPFNQNGIKPA